MVYARYKGVTCEALVFIKGVVFVPAIVLGSFCLGMINFVPKSTLVR